MSDVFQHIYFDQSPLQNNSSTDDVFKNLIFDERLVIPSAGAPSGWTGKINGVTNPSKINGIAVANITKVNGVA